MGTYRSPGPLVVAAAALLVLFINHAAASSYGQDIAVASAPASAPGDPITNARAAAVKVQDHIKEMTKIVTKHANSAESHAVYAMDKVKKFDPMKVAKKYEKEKIKP